MKDRYIAFLLASMLLLVLCGCGTTVDPRAFGDGLSYEVTEQEDFVLLSYKEGKVQKLARYDPEEEKLTVFEEMPVDVSSNISDLMMIGENFFYRRSGRYMWRLSPDGKGGYDKAYIAELGRKVVDMLLDGDTILAAAVYRPDTTKKEGLAFYRIDGEGNAVQIGLLEELEHPGTWYDLTLDGDTLICTSSACCSEEHHEYRVKIS